MEFTIHYTMGGVSYGKVISGNSEVEARAAFANEMKAQKYVITGIESLRNPKDDKKVAREDKREDSRERTPEKRERTPENRERTTENKEEKTTLEKLDDDEDAARDER